MRTTTEAPAVHAAGALGPSPYGLTRRETRAELHRLASAGWQLWELHHRFGRRRHANDKEVRGC
ncbi:MAG: hypothetical protein HOZ81_13515 [Streptomyces sp.]|nr:hypothetical protein [Streptomyces sp.]